VIAVVEEVYKERKSIHYYIEASPGAEEKVTIFTVSPGKKFKLQRVHVFFPTGTNFELEVAIFRGEEKVKPTDGVYKGDGNVFPDLTAVWYGTGEKVILWFKNLSATDVRKGSVLLEGFEV